MAPRVVVLDYGSGNLRSAQRALERVGASVVVTPDLGAAREADGLVVPGVGAYAACMAGIEALDAGPVIADRVRDGRPVLGICVGMQILFAAGLEGTAHGSVETKGLGLLPGASTRLGAGLAEGTRFYFVHSYAAPPVVDGVAVATTFHGAPFAAAVEFGPLSATQFHPEKSGDAGATLLANWVRSL